MKNLKPAHEPTRPVPQVYREGMPSDHTIRDCVEQALLARTLCLQNIRDESRTWDDERIESEATDLARYCRMRSAIIRAVLPLK